MWLDSRNTILQLISILIEISLCSLSQILWKQLFTTHKGDVEQLEISLFRNN